jgi:hypothetical protein
MMIIMMTMIIVNVQEEILIITQAYIKSYSDDSCSRKSIRTKIKKTMIVCRSNV